MKNRGEITRRSKNRSCAQQSPLVLVFCALPAARRDFASQKSDVRLLSLPRAVASGLAVGAPPLPRPVGAQLLRRQRSSAPPAQPRRLFCCFDACQRLAVVAPVPAPAHCAPMGSRPRRSRCPAWRSALAFFCAGSGGVAARFCALVPPGLRRRRSPRRRSAVRVRGRAFSWAGGEGVAASAPAGRLPGVAPPGLPLPALSVASPRGLSLGFCVLFRARGAPPGAVSAVFPAFGLRSACFCVLFRVGSSPFPRRARGALPPSPRRAPAGRPRAVILAGDGGQPPASFALRAKSVARGARALPSPLSWRLSSRRRFAPPCALRLPRRVRPPRAFARRSPPPSGGRAPAVKGGSVLQLLRIGGRARAKRRSDRRQRRRFSPYPAHQPGKSARPACTQNFVYKKTPALTKSEG